MSLWQFAAAMDGYRKAHSSDDEGGDLSSDELKNLSDFVDRPPVWVH